MHVCVQLNAYHGRNLLQDDLLCYVAVNVLKLLKITESDIRLRKPKEYFG